ncbi:MAG: hypothetical protein MSS81_07740 [Clostridiales bacterium]|nr:hypothetical protein [Clostridiales bacterium]MDD7551378.1 hypothetical protein [Clostridia bacterium]MDY5755209.1 hypothetical protein [Eubacteriales bacterium]
MIKKTIAVLLICTMLFTVAGCVSNPDVNGNSPEKVLNLCIKAFREMDAEKLQSHCIDKGNETTGGSVFGDMPSEEHTELIELMKLSFGALKVTDFSNLSVTGEGDARAAKASVTIQTYSNSSAGQLYLDSCVRDGLTSPGSGAEMLARWKTIYESGDVELVTATADVLFSMRNGAWVVIADDTFAQLLAGGAANVSQG